jgi:hypothetical protein
MSVAGAGDEQSSSGLTAQDAAARLKSDGHNELPHGDRRTPFRIILGVVRGSILLCKAGTLVFSAVQCT